MGYPMTYDRVLNRNSLRGNYTHVRDNNDSMNEWGGERDIKLEELYQRLRAISGDLRRLERDCMMDYATSNGVPDLPTYSYHRQLCEYAGVDSSTLRKVLYAFFTDCGTMPLPTITIHDEP